MSNPRKILERAFKQALTYNKEFLIPKKIKNHLHFIVENASTRKGVFTVFTTLTVYKIYSPEQDIRKHQSSMRNGFSGRGVDTKYITPTLKKIGLPAMSETGWLTRSLEQPHPYDLKYPGKIQNKNVKKIFLETVDYVQKTPEQAWDCITYLMQLAQIKYLHKQRKYTKPLFKEQIDIGKIILFLNKCFNYKYSVRGGSKIPVIAFYTMFKFLVKELKLYKNCTLKPLGSHTASDKTSKAAGDIEILKLNILEEAIEIKFKRQIDSHLIRIIREKIYKYHPKRYCVFSTEPVEITNDMDQIISHVKKEHGCQVIINGVLPTLKYYLRLISSRKDFISSFLQMVQDDLELQMVHKEVIFKLSNQFF